MSGNSNNRTSPGPRTARCDWSLPTRVRTSTVTVAASSLQWVTRMPSPNGARPHASATGHGGSPSALGGKATGDPIVAAAGAGRGSNVRVGAAGAPPGPGPPGARPAAGAAAPNAHNPTRTGA